MDIITVKTPQFKNGKIDRWHIQKGTINKSKWVFNPLNRKDGDHPIWFKDEKTLKKYTL